MKNSEVVPPTSHTQQLLDHLEKLYVQFWSQFLVLSNTIWMDNEIFILVAPIFYTERYLLKFSCYTVHTKAVIKMRKIK